MGNVVHNLSGMAATALPVWTLPELLTKARRDAGITKQQMADVLRVSTKTINNYERGPAAGGTSMNRATLLVWIDTCKQPWFTLEGISDLLPGGLPWITAAPVQLCLFDLPMQVKPVAILTVAA